MDPGNNHDRKYKRALVLYDYNKEIVRIATNPFFLQNSRLSTLQHYTSVDHNSHQVRTFAPFWIPVEAGDGLIASAIQQSWDRLRQLVIDSDSTLEDLMDVMAQIRELELRRLTLPAKIRPLEKRLCQLLRFVEVSNLISTKTASICREVIRTWVGNTNPVGKFQAAIMADATRAISDSEMTRGEPLVELLSLNSAGVYISVSASNYAATIEAKQLNPLRRGRQIIRCIAEAAAWSIDFALDPDFDRQSESETLLAFTPSDKVGIIDNHKFWTLLCERAKLRYSTRSAQLAISVLDSFIDHLQCGESEFKTGPIFLREDFDEGLFELGPQTLIRRLWRSGTVILECDGKTAHVISERELMEEAKLRGEYSAASSCGDLQAILHDLILDSTDAITSIQYLEGFEANDQMDIPTWDASKAALCCRFLSAFIPNALWDDCSARHALRDKRRPGLNLNFQLQTTLKSIRASLRSNLAAKIKWRWSAHSASSPKNDTLVAEGYYIDTVVLVGSTIYVAERVTHGTSVVQRDRWESVPWRSPTKAPGPLRFLEVELDRLNIQLAKFEASQERHRSLIALKFVGIPLVALAAAAAGVGGIISAANRAQLGLAILGLVVAVAAFILSFVDGAIEWHLRSMTRLASSGAKASVQYEGLGVKVV